MDNPAATDKSLPADPSRKDCKQAFRRPSLIPSANPSRRLTAYASSLEAGLDCSYQPADMRLLETDTIH